MAAFTGLEACSSNEMRAERLRTLLSVSLTLSCTAFRVCEMDDDTSAYQHPSWSFTNEQVVIYTCSFATLSFTVCSCLDTSSELTKPSRGST